MNDIDILGMYLLHDFLLWLVLPVVSLRLAVSLSIWAWKRCRQSAKEP